MQRRDCWAYSELPRTGISLTEILRLKHDFVSPLHTLTNVVVAAIILALLWFGHVGQAK